MQLMTRCDTPLGTVVLAADGAALTGLWFEGQRHFGAGLLPDAEERPDAPVFAEARAWLDRYFLGGDPGPTPPVALRGTTFQRAVWGELRRIPYGRTVTYGGLAQRLAARGGPVTSARAVGGAVGRNPVSIIVPCHRVLGANGALTGYAGGLWRKEALLALERA